MADLGKSAVNAMVSSLTGQTRVVIRSGRASDYADVLPKFQDLCLLDPQSVSYRRLRESIICRCLPLADHIAQRFDTKGQPRETWSRLPASVLCARSTVLTQTREAPSWRSPCPRSWVKSVDTFETTVRRCIRRGEFATPTANSTLASWN